MERRATAEPRARVAAALWLAVILVGTLRPDYHPGHIDPPLCLTCGAHASVDVILNILLFFPLGASLAWARWRGARAVAGATLLSLAIETAQFVIPGRDPSLRDVLSNTLGATLGWAVVASMGRWLVPAPTRAARLCLGAAVAVAVLFGLTGMLLHPAALEPPLSAEWAERSQTMEWYHAKVLDTRVGTMELPHGTYPDPVAAAFHVRLLQGQPLVIRARAGPPVPAFGPLLGLYDSRHALVEVGPDRQDLVLRYRARALPAGFDSPRFRLVGAFAGIRPGDSLRVVVRLVPGATRLALNGLRPATIELTVASGWTLLFAAPFRYPAARRLLSMAWMALLLLPVGFWSLARPVPLAGAALVLVAGGLWAWRGGGLHPPTAWELAGAALGLLAGWGLQRLAVRIGTASRAARKGRPRGTG